MEKQFKQYLELRQKHPDALFLFHSGDFYNLWEDDAVFCAQKLGITLSERDGMRFAGFPHHKLDEYLPRLIRLGKRVAIADQLEDPALTKKLVRRGITELVNPS